MRWQSLFFALVVTTACEPLRYPLDEPDGGERDAGSQHDSGPARDAGPTDAGLFDGGIVDAGEPDGGHRDAGPRDGGPRDAGARDGGSRDAGVEHILTIIKSGVGDGLVESAPAGISCGTTCLASFVEGATVTLTATPNRFARFVGWSGACSGRQPCTLTLTAPTTVEAMFDVQPQVVAGGAHSCAVSSTGALRCWGSGSFGRLGHNNTDNVGDGVGPSIRTAGDVLVGVPVAEVVAGREHTCALTLAGTVRCWGSGAVGTLGLNSISNVGDGVGPSIQAAGDVPIGGLVRKVSGGTFHSCALLTTGAVRCWGWNEHGQLGYGFTQNVGDGIGPSIVAAGDVPIGAPAEDVCAGYRFSCAVILGNQLRCWGYGEFGELGQGATTSIGDGVGPSIIAAGSVNVGAPVRSVSCGFFHVCAVTTSDAVRCWGLGANGRLGHDSTDNIGLTAGAIAAAGDVTVGGAVDEVVLGNGHTCARLVDGSARCWGRGGVGRLGLNATTDVGDGTTSIQAAGAVPVGSPVHILSTNTDAVHTCAITQADGVRCWGSGFQGRLGYGNTDDVGDGTGPSIISAGDVPVW
ncbi:MAG: hypothetical protein RIT81_12555 [Deltaproteobacteria bacterium]